MSFMKEFCIRSRTQVDPAEKIMLPDGVFQKEE